jgi:flagellar biosynthetic protein FliP
MAGDLAGTVGSISGAAQDVVLDSLTAASTGELGSPLGLESLSPPLQIALFLGGLVFLTAILVSVTSFTRIVIVLSFVRRALTTQEIPPNPTLIGLAMFLTLFTMGPVYDTVHREALQPLLEKSISPTVALERATGELRTFMLRHTRQRDLTMFVSLSGGERPETVDELPTRVLIPAFMISELKTSFIMGFCIYVPFILIDLLVSTVLMSLGMMMMPPVVVSAPIKLLLFVLVDGWHLVASALGASFI